MATAKKQLFLNLILTYSRLCSQGKSLAPNARRFNLPATNGRGNITSLLPTMPFEKRPGIRFTLPFNCNFSNLASCRCAGASRNPDCVRACVEMASKLIGTLPRTESKTRDSPSSPRPLTAGYPYSVSSFSMDALIQDEEISNFRKALSKGISCFQGNFTFSNLLQGAVHSRVWERTLVIEFVKKYF